MKDDLFYRLESIKTRIRNHKIDLEGVNGELEKSKYDTTDLEWSAYGCIGLVHGWGRNDLNRLKEKLEKELEQLEKEYESL